MTIYIPRLDEGTTCLELLLGLLPCLPACQDLSVSDIAGVVMGALAAGVALLFMQMHHAVHKVVHHVRLNVRPPSLQDLSCSACALFAGSAGVSLQYLGLIGRLVRHEYFGALVLTSARRPCAQEHKTPVACGTLGALLIGCLAVVLPPVAFWGELEINTLADPTRPLPHLWPQARAVCLPHCYIVSHLAAGARYARLSTKTTVFIVSAMGSCSETHHSSAWYDKAQYYCWRMHCSLQSG